MSSSISVLYRTGIVLSDKDRPARTQAKGGFAPPPLETRRLRDAAHMITASQSVATKVARFSLQVINSL